MVDFTQEFGAFGSQPVAPVAHDPGPETVQGGIFGGLNFQPLGWNSPTGNTPAQNSVTTPSLNLPSASGGLPPVGGGQALASATTPAAPTGTTGSTAGATANNWFVRAVIVILGFIFVAVGLSQFGVVQKLKP